MKYIEKDSLKNAINQLPVTEFNGVQLYPAERVKKVIDFFPIHKEEDIYSRTTEFITDYERDPDMHYAQCTTCREFIPTHARMMDCMEFCPYCGAKVTSIHNGMWLI